MFCLKQTLFNNITNHLQNLISKAAVFSGDSKLFNQTQKFEKVERSSEKSNQDVKGQQDDR